MNRERRREITKILPQVELLADEVETLEGAEEDAIYYMPEALQSGAQGQKMEDAKRALEQARMSLHDAIHYLEEARL